MQDRLFEDEVPKPGYLPDPPKPKREAKEVIPVTFFGNKGFEPTNLRKDFRPIYEDLRPREHPSLGNVGAGGSASVTRLFEPLSEPPADEPVVTDVTAEEQAALDAMIEAERLARDQMAPATSKP